MNSQRKKSIVIVDDTPENLHLLATMLGEQGYRIRSAPNGERALATIRKERPDLVLLDILMPAIDGYEVCRQLKADERLADIPVIFLSALNEAFDKVTAFANGGVDYITKPFQVEEVLARIETHLSLQQIRQDLHDQNQRLSDQNRELEAFAQTVAHDLRNPLSLILGSLELAQQSAPLSADELSQVMRLSLNGAYKLGNIIDELLLLASVRKEDVELTPIDMGDTVSQAFRRISRLTEEYQAEVILPEAWPLAVGYAPWIEEVWVNYLSNGLKYGGTPPRLELGATPQGNGTILFSVRDNGSGLEPESQQRLFTEFTRLDKVRAQGHGLGLSIVRRIMEKLDGQFGVESAAGSGSMFYFALPAAK